MSKNVITHRVVIINNVSLQNSHFTKLLGVVIDSNLKWDKHIEYLCKKVNPKIGIIHRLRPILPTSCLNIQLMVDSESNIRNYWSRDACCWSLHKPRQLLLDETKSSPTTAVNAFNSCQCLHGISMPGLTKPAKKIKKINCINETVIFKLKLNYGLSLYMLSTNWARVRW